MIFPHSPSLCLVPRLPDTSQRRDCRVVGFSGEAEDRAEEESGARTPVRNSKTRSLEGA